ncbi:type 2 lanthipeptide synthetase LanM family protein [Rossellomorea aquimaris]|uniref:Type 2 lantibiotic biosynthesis protein LanM n=1 Tax=Rossellomorea aquimaris TaxID=189382 RepID=A0A366EL83_9BACI|nr:type 2 lanthipeptide synthetase LanM family protein [Rossellomorea aquimaris]RBP02480.1 type 2 lantibiotic biosynthesis protein LanM [Rossellomorea aquimaris]
MTTTKLGLHLDSKAAVHALWMRERYNILKNNPIGLDDELSSLKKWREKKNIVSDEAFQLKLDYEGYLEEEYNNLTKVIPDNELHHYTSAVENSEWFKVFNTSLALLEEDETPIPSFDWSYPVKPFLLWAVEEWKNHFEKIKDHSVSVEVIVRELIQNLANELVSLLSRSAVLELHIYKLKEELTGDTPEERFSSFIEKQFGDPHQLVSFYTEYVTLARLLTTRTIFFVNNMKETLDHYVADYDELVSTMEIGNAKIVALKPGMGDTHQKGHTVIRFEFDSGQTVFYKPKNLKVALSYNHLIKWINSKNELLDMPFYKIICRDTYSWEYNIEKKECVNEKQIANFYERFGQILGIMYCLKGGDFHYENLIAQGEYPYIIDLETLFQQSPPLNFPDFANIKAKDAHVESVLFTSLLPQRFYRDVTDTEGIDMSGLNGKEQKLPYKVLSPKNFSTDEMVFDYSEIMLTNKDNLPKLNNEPVSFTAYVQQIIDGFRNSTALFVKYKSELLNDGLIDDFKDKVVRVILRATQRYVNMLSEGTHPDYTRDALYREHLMENMWTYPFKNKEVILHEINDMLEGDIPVFFNYPDSRDLIDGNGNRITNFLDRSSYELVRERIRDLSVDEIETQVSWLRVSLGDYDVNQQEKYSNQIVDPGNETMIDAQTLISEAQKIGDHLLKSSILSEDEKTMTWLDVTLGRNQSWSIEALPADFYDGLSGVALFYHHLYEVTEEARYKEAYEKIVENIKSVPEFTKQISAYYGKTSILQLGSRLTDGSSTELWLEQVEELEKSLNEEADHIDFLSGIAGVIQALLHLAEKNVDEKDRLLEIAGLYGDKLLTALETEKQSLIGGMAHGAAGISYVLFRLHDQLTYAKYYQAAIELLEIDRNYYVEETGAWQDGRKEDQVCLHQWCHGSAGIGLSRALTNTYYQDNNLISEMNTAAKNILKQGLKTDDGICHGNMGDTELYLTLYKQLKDPSHLHTAHAITQSVLDRMKQKGSYALRDIPGFDAIGLFTGQAGVGYQLLRLAKPESVPSLLY